MSVIEGEDLLKDLNLVPKSYFQKRRKRKRIAFYSVFSVVIIVAISVVALIPVLKIRDLKSRANSFDLRAKEVSGYLEIESEFNTLKSLYLQRENEAKSLLGSDFDVLNTIEKLESYLPEKMFIQSINFSNGQNGQAEISLQGIAGSEKEIATFYEYVSSDEIFSYIIIHTVNNLQNGSQESIEQSLNEEESEIDSSYVFDAVIYLTPGK